MSLMYSNHEMIIKILMVVDSGPDIHGKIYLKKDCAAHVNIIFNSLSKRFMVIRTYRAAKMCNATRCMTHVLTSPEIDLTTASRSA